METKSFKVFLKNDEDNRLKDLLKKIPSGHRDLLKKVSIEFQNGHTLKGSKKFVGSAEDGKFKIASPWFYSREFVVLHEIGHLVWENILSNEEKKAWNKICKKQSEECFCHAYANFYSKHKIDSLQKPLQTNFISKLL